MIRLRLTGILLFVVPLMASGCCSMPSCGTGSCSSGTCSSPGFTGFRGSSGMASTLACQGGCGEVYVDEWISEPPMDDNCGSSCGGCGSCRQCQPLFGALKQLWGKPYKTCCPNDMVGSSCGGCDSCGDGGFSGASYGGGTSCNCGSPSHHAAPMMREVPSGGAEMLLQPAPAAMVPTPAPEVDPMASHLNPARRRVVRTASASR